MDENHLCLCDFRANKFPGGSGVSHAPARQSGAARLSDWCGSTATVPTIQKKATNPKTGDRLLFAGNVPKLLAGRCGEPSNFQEPLQKNRSLSPVLRWRNVLSHRVTSHTCL
jgi:hypothetical protein